MFGTSGGLESFYLDDDEYLLTPKEAELVDEADRKYVDDKEFNDWFREFLEARHIKPVNRRMARFWSSTSNSSDDTVKLAMTLRSQQSIAKVMDKKNNLSVGFAENDEDESTWNGDKDIIIPAGPAKEAKTLYEAIDLTSGYTVHEVAHSKHTRKVNSSGVIAYRSKNQINDILGNLLEDERAETLEMQDSPGFQTYLNKRDDYLWAQYGQKMVDAVPKNVNDAEYMHKLIAAVTHVRMQEYSEGKFDPSWKPLLDKVEELTSKYETLGDKAKSSDLLQFIDLLKAVLEITPDDEERARKNPEEAKAVANVLGHGDREEDGLDPQEAQEVEGLAEEQVEKGDPQDPLFFPEGVYPPSNIIIRKPKMGSVYMPKIDNLLQKAKASFELRKATPRADERLMKDGELDEDELYRLAGDDLRVFKNTAEEVVPSAAVYFLVDISGSMHGYFDARGGSAGWNYGTMDENNPDRITVAQKMAYLLLKALEHRPNVTRRVLAHTGGTSATDWKTLGGTADFFRIWEEGDPINRLSLIRTLDNGDNYDGFAIAWAGKLLAEESAEQKLLIVLSDGQPAGGSGYGGVPAMEHVRKVSDSLARKGIDVVQISMYSQLREEHQRIMFKHFVPAPSGKNPYDTMLRNMKRLLEKVGRSA